MLAEDLPYRLEQRVLIVLEVEMQNDDRPLVALVFGNCFFDNGADLLEKIIFEAGLSAGWVWRVRDDDAALSRRGINIPGEVLLDGDGEARIKGTLNAIVPLPIVGVAVMGIQNGLIVIQKI